MYIDHSGFFPDISVTSHSARFTEWIQKSCWVRLKWRKCPPVSAGRDRDGWCRERVEGQRIAVRDRRAVGTSRFPFLKRNLNLDFPCIGVVFLHRWHSLICHVTVTGMRGCSFLFSWSHGCGYVVPHRAQQDSDSLYDPLFPWGNRESVSPGGEDFRQLGDTPNLHGVAPWPACLPSGPWVHAKYTVKYCIKILLKYCMVRRPLRQSWSDTDWVGPFTDSVLTWLKIFKGPGQCLFHM